MTGRQGASSSVSSSSCSVAQSCLILCDPMVCNMPVFPVFYYLPEFAHIQVHWVSDAIDHFILWHPLLFLPSIFPSFRVFSSKSTLLIRWPKYWSFSFSISPSNEYPLSNEYPISLLTRELIPLLRCNHLQTPPPPNAITLGDRISIYE